MSKTTKTIATVTIVIAVAAAGGYFARNHLVRSAIEDASERTLGVSTAIAGVELDLRGSSFSMDDYRADNPEGFGDEPFLRLGRGHLEVDGGTVFSDAIRIPRLELENIQLNLVQRSSDGNYRTILDNIERTRSGADEASSSGRRVVIDEIVVRDVQLVARAEIPGSDPIEEKVSLGEIRLRDVASDAGLPLDRIIARVVQGLIDRGLDRSADRLPDAIASALGQELDALPDLRARARAIADSAGASVAEEAVDRARDLLGGDDTDEAAEGGL